MKARDIMKVSLDGDLLIQEGDFIIGDSDQAHTYDIIADYPGYWKQYPFVGVGILDYQNADVNKSVIAWQIIDQLKKDGYVVKQPRITFDPKTSKLNIIPNNTRP